MPCSEHNWWFDSACPTCEPPVTVAETEPARVPDPEVEVDIVKVAELIHRELVDDTSIPKWLQRNRDGSFKYPDYPVSPPQSAQKRKLEYALDDLQEAQRDLTIGLHGGTFSSVRDLRN